MPPNLIIHDDEKYKKSSLCSLTTAISPPHIPEVTQYSTFSELLDATARSLQGAADGTEYAAAQDYQAAELALIQQAQKDSFEHEYNCPKADKTVPPSS